MNLYKTVNPYTEQCEQMFDLPSEQDIDSVLVRLWEGYQQAPSLTSTSQAMKRLAALLLDQKKGLAILISTEMGKPLSESHSEIEKCALLCRYYANETPTLLASVNQDQVYYEPLGIILGIMPWNYPFWQVLRFAIPVLMMGNAVLIKHAPTVPQCALAIERLSHQAGFSNRYANLFLSTDHVASLIEDARIQGVSLTGSVRAGKEVAQLAAKSVKKIVLELGGSDPFIVCKDAPLDMAITCGVTSRFSNSGQVCIAAKRFFVHESHIDSFCRGMSRQLNNKLLGNPLKTSTTMGPLARLDIQQTLKRQVENSLNPTCSIFYQYDKPLPKTGFFYPPTIVTTADLSVPLITEETFGPVAVIIPFSDDETVIDQANDTPYGLGASVWTTTKETALNFSHSLKAGSVFVNSRATSIPHLPFGGIKASGYGRELGKEGLLTFTNMKTIVIDGFTS